MNGRIYDPLLGRFLSADLVVQAPGSLQSYNRYSYVNNNPLTLTDPTGFYSILGLEFTDGGGVSGFMQDLASYQMAAASGAATGAGQYGVGLVQGSAAAVVGTANAIAHPIDAVQGATNGLGTLAGRAVFDTAALGGDIKNAAVATVSDPNKIGQAVGNFVTGTAIGVGAAKGLSAAGEMAGLAAKTERVAATGTAEARVAAAAPETGVTSTVPKQAPTAEFRGGPHGETKLPVGDGLESHHMPPDSVSPVSTNKGSAIQMDPADHAATSSHGSQGAAGAEYRKQIGEMVNSGDAQKVRNAYATEVKDVRRAAGEVSGDATKYNKAMQQMLEDAKKRKLLQ
jgi:hypothetical protein